MEEKKVTAAEPQVPQNLADDEQVTAVELEPVKSSSIVKFVIASVVGVFLFLIPIPQGNTFTIPVGIVINWVKALFPNYRREMENVDWGTLYNLYHEGDYNAVMLETEVKRLMADSDVQRKKGIYQYVFDHNERHLDIRAFDDNTKREVYERQLGVCPICRQHFEIEQMEADHIIPWSKGGRTVAENCQMLCRKCNREKGGK